MNMVNCMTFMKQFFFMFLCQPALLLAVVPWSYQGRYQGHGTFTVVLGTPSVQQAYISNMLLQNKPNGENRVNVNIKVIQRGLITLYTPARAYFIYKIVYLIVAFHVRSITKMILIDTPYASKQHLYGKKYSRQTFRVVSVCLCVYFSLYT